MFSKVLFIPKIGGDRVSKSLELIEEAKFAAYANEIKVLEKEAEIDKETLLIPVGGDGTVIHAAKLALKHNVPIIGFNLGNVGFLTDISFNEAIDNAFSGLFVYLDDPAAFKIEERMLIEATHLGRTYLALNDFVISNVYADSIIKYQLAIGDSYAGKHKANSVIVSTPTGSTAYALMAGGSIIEPDLDVLEIVSVAALTMTSRPLIVSGDRSVTISLSLDERKKDSFMSCKADGQQVLLLSKDDQQITIKKHEKKLKMLHFKDWNYFQNLTSKLGWAK